MPLTWRSTAAIAALLVPALSLAAAPEAAPLSITARPQLLRLAEGGRAVVRVAAPEMPVVTASAGRLEGLREAASGVYEVEYLPPETVDPQVVIISASSGGRFGWTTISLAGVREVVVRAPHRSLVSVNVGTESFGPIPADGTGRAVLRVDVPPGVQYATSRGNRIDLDVPRRGFSHVALERLTAEANASATVDVRVIALDERGQPLRRPPVKLEASEGTLSPVVEIARGVVASDWKLSPGRVRRATVNARVASKPPSTAMAALQRVAGDPVAVRLETDRDRVVAGEGDEVTVTGSVVDSAGNPTDVAARLVVSLATGQSSRLLPDAVVDWQQTDGVYTGRVRVPRRRSGTQKLELQMIGPGGLAGTHVVELAPGPAATVSVTPEEVLYADGREHQLRIALLDEFGNRAQGDGTAVVTAARGDVGTPTRAAPGLYFVDYRPPLSATSYDEVIRARVGPLEGTARVLVRARGGAVVVGLKGGYAVATGSLSSPAGAVEVGFWRPALSASVGLVLEVRYFAFSKDQTLTAPGLTLPASADASFLALEPSLAWRRPLVGGMLWLGAGPGLVRSSTTLSAPGQEDLTATSWVPSAHASVGWGLPLGPGIPFVELKGGWQGEDDESAVRGSVETLTVNLGYRFDVL